MRYARVISGTPLTDEDIAEDGKKKVGRPPTGRQNTLIFQARLSPEDNLKLTSVIKKLGKTNTQWIRDVITSIDEKPGNILVTVGNQPTYLSEGQAKNLYKQLTKILLGD